MLKMRWPSRDWLSKLLLPLFTAVGLAVLYVWRLGNLTVGLSPYEAVYRSASSNLSNIWSHPVYAPQQLIQYGMQVTDHHGAFWVRLPSVFFALVFLGLYYLIAKAWFGRGIAILSTVILASTPWLVLLGRNASPTILLLSPLFLLLAYDWLKKAKPKQQRLAWLLLVLAATASLYVPGMVWLVVVGVIAGRNQLGELPHVIGRAYFTSVLVVGLILVSPLVFASISNLIVAKQLVLWPLHWLTPIDTVKAVVWSCLSIFWRTPYHIPTIIGRLPLLNVTQIVLILFGSYIMWIRARKELFMLVGLVLFAIIFAGINHDLLLLTLSVPGLAILIAAGLRYLYTEWRTVFPNNPIPRALAVSLMVILVFLNLLLGVRYSLAAWPHTMSTHQLYVIK